MNNHISQLEDAQAEQSFSGLLKRERQISDLLSRLDTEPDILEQLVVATVQQLRQLETLLGYEFTETIDHIQRLYDLHTKPLQPANEYAELSGKDVASRIVALNREVA